MFDWDEHNIPKVEAHRVGIDEAEQVLRDPDRVVIPGKRADQGEARFVAIGRTNRGRLLGVVFVRRNRGIRVITAREPAHWERRLYRRLGK